jgi:hypothetical protein
MTTRRRALKLQVVAPCNEDWNRMPGGDDIRFCGKCRQNVYNLSALTESQARELAQGPVCVRFFHRGDGTVITRKCSPMREAARRRLISLAAGVASVLPLAAGFWGSVAWLRALVKEPSDGRSAMMGAAQPRPRPAMGEPMPPSREPPRLMGKPSPPVDPPAQPKPKRPPLMGRVRH